MWREMDLTTSPYCLLSRHIHQGPRVGNHWPLLEYTLHNVYRLPVRHENGFRFREVFDQCASVLASLIENL
jgi:hypothetical protein